MYEKDNARLVCPQLGIGYNVCVRHALSRGKQGSKHEKMGACIRPCFDTLDCRWAHCSRSHDTNAYYIENTGMIHREIVLAVREAATVIAQFTIRTLRPVRGGGTDHDRMHLRRAAWGADTLSIHADRMCNWRNGNVHGIAMVGSLLGPFGLPVSDCAPPRLRAECVCRSHANTKREAIRILTIDSYLCHRRTFFGSLACQSSGDGAQ